MPGGLLNIVSVGAANVILNGNPSKTFFKSTYKKYTNFGKQKFRIDFNGQRKISLTTETVFNFKIPRHGDLLSDTYLVFNLPKIWSGLDPNNKPYNFKWIENIGSEMIKEITLTSGGQTIQKFSGNFLANLVDRDFTNNKKELYNQMIGNIDVINNPKNVYTDGSGNHVYPTSIYHNPDNDPNYIPGPSINSRKLYIPLNFWFTLLNQCAFPLVCLQYADLYINITIRPIIELFTIQNRKPDFTNIHEQLFNFVHPQPKTNALPIDYSQSLQEWDTDLHLISTYIFLSNEETKVFAENEQNYLIKQCYEYNFKNIAGSKGVELETTGLVVNWMFYFRRSDAYLYNDWSNYKNINRSDKEKQYLLAQSSNGHAISNKYTDESVEDILLAMGILLDGKYRESILDVGIYNYIEKYSSTSGNASSGLYTYNFCLDTTITSAQPSGAINLSKFNKIELELNTIKPPFDPNAQTYAICDSNNALIGVNKASWDIFKYTYDLIVQEERYNILEFKSGVCGLVFSR